jgi:hypothetical protein
MPVLAEAGLKTLPPVKRVVLVGNRISPGNPVTKPDGTVVRTLWGELAHQLRGKTAFARIAQDDERATSPGDMLRALLQEAGGRRRGDRAAAGDLPSAASGNLPSLPDGLLLVRLPDRQTEWATDLIFTNPAALAAIYPQLVDHAMHHFKSPDGVRFELPLELRLPTVAL